jgi:hypothetical protein
MSKLPHLAWNTTKATNIYLEKLDINDCTDSSIGDCIDKIFENYKMESILPFSEDELEPVKKIKIV